LKVEGEKLEKMAVEYEKDCIKADKLRRLQAPSKPDPCVAKKKAMDDLTQKTKNDLENTKKLPCYEPEEPFKPPPHPACGKLLELRKETKLTIDTMKVVQQEKCTKKRNLQSATPEKPAKPEPTEQE